MPLLLGAVATLVKFWSRTAGAYCAAYVGVLIVF